MEDADLVRLCQNGDLGSADLVPTSTGKENELLALGDPRLAVGDPTSEKTRMAAFEQLFHRHQERVYTTALRMMNNEEDAQDLTQEIFVKAYRNISKFNYTSAFSTWLYRLAVNLCIDELRKRKRSANTVPLEEALSQADANTPEDHAISRDTERQVWNAINTLKEKERAIIILRDMEGLSYKEIAEVLKCSLGRVKSRLHEARQKLKVILEARTELWTDYEEV